MSDQVKSYNFRQGDLDTINKCINDSKNYYTEARYTKEIQNGHEVIKGAFLSVKKDYLPNVPNSYDSTIYYASNKNYLPKGSNNTYYSSSHNTSSLCDTIKQIVIVLLLICVLFLVFDFYSVYKKTSNENNLEREKCLKDFNENDCANLSANDGEQLKNFCLKAKKCIEDNTVLFHVVLVKYVKTICGSLFGGMGIVQIAIFAVTMMFVVNQLMK